MADKKSRQDAVEYIVVNNAFFDGVQLHEPGARVLWAGPRGGSLDPVDEPRRKTNTDAPLFPDPLAGRGDGMAVPAAKPGQAAVFLQ